jgi:hypothetical protein
MKDEIWKDIKEYSGIYKISSFGRVISLKYNKIKILKPQKNSSGYLHVILRKEKKAKAFNVHQLVAIEFLGHVPNGTTLVIDHINDIKTDNRLENLRIIPNRFNVHKTRGKYSSKYQGVSWRKDKKQWQSSVVINKKSKFLGLFDCELKAHLEYKNALKKYNCETM